MDAFNIVDHFYNSAKKYPDKAAIIYRGKSITFSELEKQVSETANYFLSKGIGKGDRVMLFVPMSMDLYRTVLALFRIGAVAVFLDEWVSKKRLEVCCEIAECKAFIGILKARVFALFSRELRKIPIKLGTSYSIKKNNLNISRTFPEDTALITFTTGSTGTPKAAKRTHGFLNEQFNALLEKIDPQPDDIDMPVLPIVLLINLGSGNTSVIAEFKASKPDSLNPQKVVEQLLKYKVTRIVSSPFFLKKISEYLTKHNIVVPQLKKAFTGGAPVFPDEAEIYTKALTATNIQIVYGSTEAEPISSVRAEELVKKQKENTNGGLLVGKLHRTTNVKIIRIVDEPIIAGSESELNNFVLKPGEVGEIIVSGPHVLKEYYNNTIALKRNKIFIGDNVWHRTGDSGYFDNENNLYLTGRCNSIFLAKGKLIAPFIYENYLQRIAGMGTVMNLNGTTTIIAEAQKKDEEKIRAKIHASELFFDNILFVRRVPRDPRHNSKIDYEKLKSIL